MQRGIKGRLFHVGMPVILAAAECLNSKCYGDNISEMRKILIGTLFFRIMMYNANSNFLF